MRNKAKGFPYTDGNNFDGEPRAKPEFSSRRPDGTINTNPQGRMRASGARKNQDQ